MKQQLLCLMVLSAGLVACGGGSSDKDSQSNSSRSAASNLVTQGMITGFGSVIVNGVHYDVDEANLSVDDDSVVESELDVGQMVRIVGSAHKNGHGKAVSLISETQLRGPIESIDLTAGVIVALGQTILITADTFYKDGQTADQLEVGDIIRVSSYTDDEGALVATRIDLKSGDTGNSLQIIGAVSNLDTRAMTFTINDLMVDYSKVTLANLPNATLSNGMLVNLQGRLVNDVFVAVGNLRKSRFGFHHDDDISGDVEISGLITHLIANTSLKIGDVSVLINNATQYKHCRTTPLSEGELIKVKGVLDSNQNLTANEIKCKPHSKIESRGLISAIDLTAKTFSLNNLTFSVTDETSFQDSGHSQVRFFDLEDLSVGDAIRVRGYNQAATTDSTAKLIATRVERRVSLDDDDFTLEFNGVIEAVGLNSVTVSGKEIRFDDNTQLEGFADLSSFLALALGLEVEIKVDVKDGQLVAIKIEIEEEHHSSSSAHSNSSSAHSSSAHSSTSNASNSSSAN